MLFCTERSGGTPPALENMVELAAPADEGIFKGKAQHFVAGPRVAPGKVGKGALAATFGLNCLIDDREECLESFQDGVLDALFGVNDRPHKLEPPHGLLLLASFRGRSTRPSLMTWLTVCASWQDVLSSLSRLLLPDLPDLESDPLKLSLQSSSSDSFASADEFEVC